MVRYTLKRSKRARYMRLRVLPGGNVVVTAPFWSGERAIERFVNEHAQWLLKAIARMQDFKTLPVSLAGQAGRRAYLKYKEEARAFVTERIVYWNKHYEFAHGRIAIKNTKRLWGSCSRKGNLNFSYALLFLPRELADYVIVHELCHLKEHNHGVCFWENVARVLPEYQALKCELRRYLPAR